MKVFQTKAGDVKNPEEISQIRDPSDGKLDHIRFRCRPRSWRKLDIRLTSLDELPHNFHTAQYGPRALPDELKLNRTSATQTS
jgi:hypothetical protein